jgi:preprotein translocase subunit YajC
MGVSYLGIHVNFGIYIALLLAVLIIFITMLIISERRRQRRYHERLRRLKEGAKLKLIV